MYNIIVAEDNEVELSCSLSTGTYQNNITFNPVYMHQTTQRTSPTMNDIRDISLKGFDMLCAGNQGARTNEFIARRNCKVKVTMDFSSSDTSAKYAKGNIRLLINNEAIVNATRNGSGTYESNVVEIAKGDVIRFYAIMTNDNASSVAYTLSLKMKLIGVD